MSHDPKASPVEASFSRDLLASVVVFLVALPLCMGIAIASGVPPALGLITGIVGGLVVGFIAGCPLQVSGPAAGLAVIVWEIVREHGIEALGVIVLVGGLIQLAAGLLRLGQWFRAVSPAVIQGMLSGIGVLIFASQFHVMLDDAPKGSGLQNLATIPIAIRDGVLPLDGSIHQQAALIGALTICAVLAWTSLTPRRLSVVPGPLVAVVVATVAASIAGLAISRVEVPANLLGSIEIGGTIGNLGRLADPSIIGAAIALALIASAETLLCATATDRLHDGPRTDYDRELAAQGVGNAVCGLLGALPMTGVIVRSTANIGAGATTRRSAILHGVWLLAFVAALPFVLAMIPTAALAAILVHIGYKLVNPGAIRDLKKRGGWGEVVICVATIGTIVATDLLTGVVVGFGLAAARLLWSATRLRVQSEALEDGSVRVDLVGASTFLGLPRLAQALESIPMKTRVQVRLDHLTLADAATLDFLHGYQQRHIALGGEVEVCWDTLRSRTEGPPALATTPVARPSRPSRRRPVAAGV